ncbi:MAG: hypothetical protein AAB388_00735 [Patescibacteria group bacterium]
MLYNKEEQSRYLKTAGKITIFTAVVGLAVFLVAFIFDAGTQQLSKVSAQSATTTLTVLNTPPFFTTDAYEVVESSTSSPTNSGTAIQFAAVATDSNGAPYFLLVCSSNATPTANAAAGPGNLGTAPPDCGGGTQWGVSTAAASGALASVSTTTAEVAPFAELNTWYAWVCDDDPFNPRCNATPVQGFSATNSSPFNVNSRPVLTNVWNDGPKDPGDIVTFNSTSTDPDSVGGEDDIYLIVCSDNTSYNPTTNSCGSAFLASTTVGVAADADAAYTLASILRDAPYPAYGYIIDEHGHEALANPDQSNFTVNNVAPVVLGGDISLNSGSNITLTQEGAETTGFTLDFTVRDANSCLTSASSSEITDYVVSVFRSSYGTTTCTGAAGSYNPNYCYPNGLATTTWNLSCTASSTQCTSPFVDQLDYTCTFPLWFVADPTDAAPETPAAFAADNWSVGIAGADDDFATSSMATTTNPVELISFTALDLLTAQIPYGSLEPGDDTGTLSATTSVLSVGNTGLDQEVEGESMCGTFAIGSECAPSATSTIPESEQQFASTSLAYNSPLAIILSSSTVQEVELDVAKTTSTSTPSSGVTYWGISVPISITLAGSYQGLNTFYAVTAEATDW